jgi:hypothetical protein
MRAIVIKMTDTEVSGEIPEIVANKTPTAEHVNTTML